MFHRMLVGRNNGAKLVVVDPRRSASASFADLWLGVDVGSDIALANAMAAEIIAAGTAQRILHRPCHGRLRGLRRHR